MAEKDEKEKETRTRIDTRTGEAERDVRTSRSADDDDRDRSRRRRDFRDTGRSMRRASTDFLTYGCGFLGDLLVGVGEAISPRRSSRYRDDDEDDDRRGNCWDEFGCEVRTYNRSDEEEEDRGRSSARSSSR